jgi:hypothetical protein
VPEVGEFFALIKLALVSVNFVSAHFPGDFPAEASQKPLPRPALQLFNPRLSNLCYTSGWPTAMFII